MKKIIVLSFFGFVLIYSLFQGRSLIVGPRIKLESPIANSSVERGMLVAKGTAKNTTSLSINDHNVPTDPEGHFESKLIAYEGINIIKFEAKDRFGRETVRFVRIVGN